MAPECPSSSNTHSSGTCSLDACAWARNATVCEPAGALLAITSVAERAPAAVGEKLIELLSHGNDWIVRRARRILADRRDPEVIFPLRRMIAQSKHEPVGLQALWALYVSGGFNEGFAAKSLDHRSAPVRKWSVRLLGDEKHVWPGIARQLAEQARTDPDVSVRAQLASSAQRLPPKDALPIIETLLLRDIDGHDPYIPLLLWWATERHAVSALAEVESFFRERGWPWSYTSAKTGAGVDETFVGIVKHVLSSRS